MKYNSSRRIESDEEFIFMAKLIRPLSSSSSSTHCNRLSFPDFTKRGSRSRRRRHAIVCTHSRKVTMAERQRVHVVMSFSADLPDISGRECALPVLHATTAQQPASHPAIACTAEHQYSLLCVNLIPEHFLLRGGNCLTRPEPVAMLSPLPKVWNLCIKHRYLRPYY